MNNNYNPQDRGSQNSYKRYLSSMDAIAVEKVASASVFFNTRPGNVIVDVGMASGTSTNILAHLFPRLNIIGVDINPKMVAIAKQTYQAPNLDFRLDDGEKLTTFKDGSVDGFFNCSSIHHITSFNGYESGRAYNTLKRQATLLKTKGIIVVRDFVKPPEMEVIIELDCIGEDERPGDADLLLQFSTSARSLANPNEKGFPVKEVQATQKNTRRFRLFYADAVEFIRRKDYYRNWDIELQEEYGYFTQKEFEEVFASLGLRIIVSFPVFNPWIIRNRYRGKFILYDKYLNNIGFPPTNYLIAGEKAGHKGTRLKIERHLPEIQDSFLKYNSYRDLQTGKIYDVVLRPNTVMDIIPYYSNQNSIEIIAKHGYPRPIVNVETDSPVIDQKRYSGYITEGMSAVHTLAVEDVIMTRTDLRNEDFSAIEPSLGYYTSPGGIDEKVESVFVKLSRFPSEEFKSPHNLSRFADSGSIRRYDAIQLLKTAQTGALVEARLELNIYNLLRKLDVHFPEWLGERIEIAEMPVRDVVTIDTLLSCKEERFCSATESASYLQQHRAKFTEAGVVGSSEILEFITPRHVSANTLTTLPVAKCNNEVYVGIEMRHLPVPQIHAGNSCIPVAPAVRLPKEVITYNDLEEFITNHNIFGTPIKGFSKLGEKFFPSVGVTPEQVYPYVVTLAEPNATLKWVSLKELYHNLDKLRDGHLLISIVRLVHAIN